MLKLIQVKSGKRALVRLSLTSQKTNACSTAPTTVNSGSHAVSGKSFHPRIGNRDIVGFGINGRPQYFDHPPFPMPSVRWAPNTPELIALREKAKGDWVNLTQAEKKELYRADFCQTLSEVCTKGNGDWKFTLGIALGFVGITLWGYQLFTSIVYNFPRPQTNTQEHQARMLERMIAQGMGKIFGYSSQWDYEKGKWKK